MGLQNIFYTLGIIYMVLNILILLGIGIGIFFIVRIVLDIKKQIMEKIKYVENAMHHPEDAIADLGRGLIKSVLLRAKSRLNRKRSSE